MLRRERRIARRVKIYNEQQVDIFLDIAEEVVPINIHEWSIITERYKLEIKEHQRAVCDFDPLKGKFEKLAPVKKLIGEPSCPPAVRGAKHIARDMLNMTSRECWEL